MPRRLFQYPAENIHAALTAIREHGMSIRKASREFGIPKTTLLDKFHGRSAVDARKVGPATILTQDEEKELSQWLIYLAKTGFPRKKHDLLNTVMKIVRDDQRKTPFRNGRPGETWYKTFLSRHPELTLREPETISKGRAFVTEMNIRSWFDDLKNYLKEVNAEDILAEPQRIINADETNFQLCTKSGKVLAPRKWQNVYEVMEGNEKETLTVLGTFSADGAVLPPMIVYPYVKIPKEICSHVPANYAIGRSDSGWMKSETFYEYVANTLNAYLIEHNVKKPVLFLIDGHRSHLTLQLSNFCNQNGIILYSLLPNATHILQPADVSIFRPLKAGWRCAVHDWYTDHPHQVLTKAQFAPLLDKVIKKKATKETIQNGFRACGIFPFDPDAVDYSKCVRTFAIENQAPTCSVITVPEEEVAPSLDDYVVAARVLNWELGPAVMKAFTDTNADKEPEVDQQLYRVWKRITSKANGDRPTCSQKTVLSHEPEATREISQEEHNGNMTEANRDTQEKAFLSHEETREISQEEHNGNMTEANRGKEKAFHSHEETREISQEEHNGNMTEANRDTQEKAFLSHEETREISQEEHNGNMTEVNRGKEKAFHSHEEIREISQEEHNGNMTEANRDTQEKAFLSHEEIREISQEEHNGNMTEANRGQETAVLSHKPGETREIFDAKHNSQQEQNRPSTLTAFQAHLFWPKPKPKNYEMKGACRKMLPHAISSSAWRKHHEDNDAKKKKDEEEKNRRKEKREQKRIEKELKAQEKKNKQQEMLEKNNETSGNRTNKRPHNQNIKGATKKQKTTGTICNSCEESITNSSAPTVTCAECKVPTHIFCITRLHKEFFPEIEDSDQDSDFEYQCPKCFYIQDSSEADSDINSAK